GEKDGCLAGGIATAAGLSTRCGVLEYSGPQAFGGAINSGREARRTGADDHQVVHQVLERQSPRATPLTTAGRPVKCEMSPVNSPGRWMVTVFGSSPERSTISTSPDFTTKKFMFRWPTAKSTCPSRNNFGSALVHPASCLICISSSVGNATD